MPGQLCDGHALRTAKSKDSKAYCAGMAYRASGYGDAVPVTDNPHESGSDAAVAWAAGWDAADAKVGGTMTQAEMGCCSVVADIPAALTP